LLSRIHGWEEETLCVGAREIESHWMEHALLALLQLRSLYRWRFYYPVDEVAVMIVPSVGFRQTNDTQMRE
jgi:hypothetical protein